jgi:hypothetical protein
MTKSLPAACWAMIMILLALLARFGVADGDAMVTMLLVMPMLAYVSMQRGRRCATSARSA